MTRKDEIKSAYKSLGGAHSFYDGMMTGTTFLGRMVVRTVWRMSREDMLEYQAGAFDYITDDVKILVKGILSLRENKKVDSSIIINNLIKDFSMLLQDVKNIKNMADENSEFKTSALMDEMIEDYTKKLWMLKQSVE